MQTIARLFFLGLAALPIAGCGTGDSASPQYPGAPPPDTLPATAPGDSHPDAGSPVDSSRVRMPAERGAEFVEMRGCPGCHQSPNSSDGILSGQSTPLRGTMAFGANLTPDPETGIGTWSDEHIVRAIRTGQDDQGAALCPPMPHFGGVGDAEASDIVVYLRALAPVKHKAPDSQCAGKEPPEEDAGPDGGDAGDASSTPRDAGADAGCSGFAAPGSASTCHSCVAPLCQPNGCRGGYWCDVAKMKCHPKPAACR